MMSRFSLKCLFFLILFISNQSYADTIIKPAFIYKATLESCQVTHFDPQNSELEARYLTQGLPGHQLNQFFKHLEQTNQVRIGYQIIESPSFLYAIKKCYPTSPSDQFFFKNLVTYQLNNIENKKWTRFGLEVMTWITAPALIALRFHNVKIILSSIQRWSLALFSTSILPGSTSSSNEIFNNFFISLFEEQILDKNADLKSQIRFHTDELKFLIETQCSEPNPKCSEWQQAYQLFSKLNTN